MCNCLFRQRTLAQLAHLRNFTPSTIFHHLDRSIFVSTNRPCFTNFTRSQQFYFLHPDAPSINFPGIPHRELNLNPTTTVSLTTSHLTCSEPSLHFWISTLQPHPRSSAQTLSFVEKAQPQRFKFYYIIINCYFLFLFDFSSVFLIFHFEYQYFLFTLTNFTRKVTGLVVCFLCFHIPHHTFVLSSDISKYSLLANFGNFFSLATFKSFNGVLRSGLAHPSRISGTSHINGHQTVLCSRFRELRSPFPLLARISPGQHGFHFPSGTNFTRPARFSPRGKFSLVTLLNHRNIPFHFHFYTGQTALHEFHPVARSTPPLTFTFIR